MNDVKITKIGGKGDDALYRVYVDDKLVLEMATILDVLVFLASSAR